MTSQAVKAVRGRRKRKQKVSRPAQMNLNDKNSNRYFVQCVQGTFGAGDLYLTLTYKPELLPATLEDAEKDRTNYIRRLKDRNKKQGLPDLVYVYITEYELDEDEKFVIRVHHHLILKTKLNRDEVEDAWAVGRGKKRQSIGFVTNRRIKTGDDGIASLAIYHTKMKRWKKGKKKWSGSQNLKRPIETKNDHKYSRRKIESYARSNDYGLEEFAKIYPDYHITDIRAEYFDLTGWHIYLTMWKKDEGG